MTNPTTNSPDETRAQAGMGSSLAFRPSLVIRISVLIIAVSMMATTGCGSMFQDKSKPTLYRVTGRVLDPFSKKPLVNVRLQLRAAIPIATDIGRLPARGGVQPRDPNQDYLSWVIKRQPVDRVQPRDSSKTYLVANGFTRANGTYDLELSEGFEVLRSATDIRIEAFLGGYEIGTMDMPVPNKPQKSYAAPDLYLSPRLPAAPPTNIPRSNPPEKPIPWK
jgi:hypothetical protein